MTRAIHVKRASDLHAYERNLSDQPKRKRPKKDTAMKVVGSEYTVTIHMSPDCAPETQQALAEMLTVLMKQIEEGKWRKK